MIVLWRIDSNMLAFDGMHHRRLQMSAQSNPVPNQQFNIRLRADLKARLEKYAQLVDRPQANVACEALADYLDWRVAQNRYH